MATIFISYRRDDAAAYAGRLYDGLRARYGGDHVFMDVDRIQPGENFAAVIERSVRNADVVLAVIGSRWLHVTDETQRRRLDDPDDFVRLELKAALETGRRLIPVLVDDAPMPDAQTLPPALQPLAGVQAVNLSNERWDYDFERLTRSIDAGPEARPRRGRIRTWAIAGLVTAIAAGALWWFAATPNPARLFARVAPLRAAPADLSVDAARAMVAQRNFFHAQWNRAAPAAPLDLEQQVVGTDIVIRDPRHGLLWQQGASPRTLNRRAAQDYLQALNARRFAGHDDWRLPTLEEALTLMSAAPTERCRLPAPFERSALIMRSADTAGDGRDWIVYFCDGIAAAEDAGFNAQVRAVRTQR
jgi:hypothetical protein